MAGIDFPGMKPFNDNGDASADSLRWRVWLEEFEAFADSKGLFITDEADDNKAQRRALLLYIAGAAVRETFRTLDNISEAKDDKKVVDALDKQYTVKTNNTYQHHKFRTSTQGDETVAQYVTRLKRAADGCDFQADRDSQIRDQVVASCRSNHLRKKLLDKGGNLTLADTLKLVCTFETVESQFHKMKLEESNPAQAVNQVWPRRRGHAPSLKRGACYRCGYTGHYGRDPNCPARGKNVSLAEGLTILQAYANPNFHQMERDIAGETALSVKMQRENCLAEGKLGLFTM